MKLFFVVLLLLFITQEIEATNDTVANLFDYHVCGNETKLTDCTCENTTMECTSAKDSDERHWYNRWRPPFNNLNIEILNVSFLPKHVILNNNNIEKLKKGKVLPGQESTVESLQLINNEMREIENGTFDKFTSLQSLDFSCNFLRNISSGIFTKQLGSTLKTFKIVENWLLSISTIDLSNMERLEEFDISKNGIGLDKNFTKYIFPKSLANLKSLNLSHNRIRNFNDDIFVNLISLEYLNLDGAGITVFPKSINRLSNLRTLNFRDSYISSLNYTDLQALTKLETFDMPFSSLKNIDDCTFCNKSNLKSVMLYKNPSLAYIHENAFGNVYNQSVAPLSMESFSVEACFLSIIPEKLLNWHSMKEFGLGKNPFICNCSMAWLIDDILSPTHSNNLRSFLPQIRGFSWELQQLYEENSFKCFGPYALKNILFSHISQKLWCPVEAEKKVCVNERMPTATVIMVIVACMLTFILGWAAAIFSRPLQTSKTQEEATVAVGFTNQNFADEETSIAEDFDEIKIYH